MKKPSVLLADLDPKNLDRLEYAVLNAFEDKIELESTDSWEYAVQIATTTKQFDVLIASEALYSGVLSGVNAEAVLVLTEIPQSSISGVQTVFKYDDFERVRTAILTAIKAYIEPSVTDFDVSHSTRFVVVTSAAGGSGKTRTALGLCNALAREGLHVLYIDAEYDQTFSYFMNDKSPLSDAAARAISLGDNSGVGTWLRREGFDYCPPLPACADSLGIDISSYAELIRGFLRNGVYDFVVADTDAYLTEYKKELFRMAHRIVFVIPDDAYAGYKTARYVKLLDDDFKGKVISVLNAIGNAGSNTGAISRENCDITLSREKGDALLADLGCDPGIGQLVNLVRQA